MFVGNIIFRPVHHCEGKTGHRLNIIPATQKKPKQMLYDLRKKAGSQRLKKDIFERAFATDKQGMMFHIIGTMARASPHSHPNLLAENDFSVFIKTAKVEGIFGNDVDTDDKDEKTTDSSERKHFAHEDVAGLLQHGLEIS